MADFGKILRTLRKERNLSQTELSNALKVSFSTISMYERGEREPNFETLEAIADYFNVTMNYLLGRSDEQTLPDKKAIPQYPNIREIRLKKFPIIGKIACGKPIFANEDKESYIMADMDISADFCLIASGDSMINARINDGDIVFVREASIVDNGDIAAVIIDDEATLKRVYYYPEQDKLVLNAENAKYPPFVYVGEELNHIRILGKAVYFMSAL